MISEKERLFTALAGERPDRPPVLCPGGMMTMAVVEAMEQTRFFWPEAHHNAAQMAGLVQATRERTGLGNVGVPFCMTIEAEAWGSQVDFGGPTLPPRVVAEPARTPADFARFAPLNPERDGRLPVVLEALGRLREALPETPVLGNLVGPVSLAGSLTEAPLLFRWMRRAPDEVHRILDFLTENLVAFGQAQIRAGADVLTLADPTACGEILGGELFAEFAVPYLRRLTHAFQATGTPTIVHICGRIRTIAAHLPALGAQAISIDAVASFRDLTPETVRMGNVSAFLLEKGPPHRIKRGVQGAMRQGAQIVAPACGWVPTTPIAHLRALTEAVDGKGK